MKTVSISREGIEHTLRHLQTAGRRKNECIVLWLGRQESDCIRVQQIYRPAHLARADVFRIPSDSMKALLFELSSNQLMIAAQVHSHPFEAFHSKADDAWAIVRHVGALSLVVPDFALTTTPNSFLQDTKVFLLTNENIWREVPSQRVEQCLMVH